MIFLDTNVILRFLIDAPGGKNAAMSVRARGLFQAVRDGDETVTTSEVVLHEVCYVLGSKKHYELPAAVIAEYVSSLLLLPGFRLSNGEKEIFLDALEIFKDHPKLEFSDSVIAVRAQRAGLPLATFDQALLQLSIVTPWQAEDQRQP